jgi:hypothetical protein
MQCKYCGSGDQQIFLGELTLAPPGIERVKLPPVYICVEASVCLHCGKTELLVPTDQLELLRSTMGSNPSRR